MIMNESSSSEHVQIMRIMIIMINTTDNIFLYSFTVSNAFTNIFSFNPHNNLVRQMFFEII